MIVFFFWFSILLIFYTYLGYPLYLYILYQLRNRPIQKNKFSNWPSVSVVIAAKNEELRIVDRIENIFNQNYPSEKLNLIVVSDGSTDKTVNYLHAYVEKKKERKNRIQLIEYFPSRGKPHALNRGVHVSKSEIIVFADCRQQFDSNAITELVCNFSDSLVGGVSGELLFLDDKESFEVKEMGIYWKYEKFIRKMESTTGSVMGATGAIYAIRRKLFAPLSTKTLLDDVLIPMHIVKEGYRILFDGSAKAYDKISENMNQEWNRKVRTLAGNWQFISLAPYLFNPRHSRIFLRFISHKFLRLLVPFMLIYLFGASFFIDGALYNLLLFIQIGFYLTAVTTAYMPCLQQNSLARVCYFFCVLNTAAIWSFGYWATGKCQNLWVSNPSKKQ